MFRLKRKIVGKSGIFLGIAIFMVLIFMLMFLALPNTASEINKTAERLGLDILKTDPVPEVASAWEPPYSGGKYNFTDLDFNVQSPVSISSPTQLTAPGSNTFNKAVDYGSVEDVTNTATSWKAKSTSTSAYSHHLWYRDYIFTDTMKAGFRNNLINSVTYTMNIDWSLGFDDDGGDVYQNMFIAFGSSSSTTPDLTTFTTLTSAVNGTGKVDVRESSNGTLDADRTVTLTKDGTTHLWPGNVSGDTLYSTTNLVMRVGAFLFVQPNRSFWGAGVTWPITDFQNPNGSALSMSWTQPSLNVVTSGTNNYGAVTASTGATGYINKGATVTVSTFAFASQETITATATGATANEIYGYYFSGWTSSQTMRFSNRSLSFTIRGACDLPRGENTYTANFRRYELTGAQGSYTYAQSGGGTSVQQGPIVPSDNPLTNDAAIPGLHAVYSYTSGTYNSTNRPTDVATYSLKIDIKDASNNVYSSSQHVYGFSIQPLNITAYSLSLIDTYNYDTTDHSYSSPGVRISPTSFTFALGPVTYVLTKDVDYTIDNFFGDWVNSTNNPAVIADPTLRPGLQLNLGSTGLKGNFSGTSKAYAEINPLSLSSVSLVADMNNEIRARYDTVYTGFEVKPEVILVRLIYAGKEMKLIAHDPNNADPDRQQLYINNYASFGAVESYSAYGVYGVGNTAWVSGFFALQTNSYANNIDPSTNTAEFTLKIVKADTNEYQNFVGSGGRTDTENVTKTVKFDIPKRIVDDTYNNEANAVTIIEDYTQATYKPYVGPIVYNGEEKHPHVYYVLVKVTNARLWVMHFSGSYYWKDNATAYFSLTNASNQAGDPTPPLTFTEYGITDPFPVINAGTFVSSLSYTATGKDNINVASGGVVNISASPSAKIDGDFQLSFPIYPKQLYREDPLISPGGGYILSISDQTFNFGNSITPAITAKATYDYSPEGLANDNEVVLTLNDYNISYSNNTDITKSALVTLEGKNNYVGTITKTFNICALDITLNGDITLENLPNVVYTGTQFSTTSAQLTVDAGANGTYNVNSSEYTVTGAGTNLNAGPGSFTISFGGYVAGTGESAGTGPRFAGTKTVAFTILPKNINSGNISKTATWVAYDSSLVTYDGNAKTNLPIVTTGSVKTVVIKDNDRSGIELVYSTTSGSGDYMLAATGTWGTNPNAGLENGTVKFIGLLNYTGEVTVPFQILPKSITGLLNITLYTGAGSGYNQSLNGYSFTGSRIEPQVTKVEVDRGGAGLLELSLITDYNVSYGTADPQKNVYATKGGLVTITGTGNYKDTQTKAFNILPIDQQVTFINATLSDPDVRVESITKVSGHQYYADYEINADNLQGREILLEARTTAIYPSARLIKFSAFPSSANITVSGISYLSCTLQEIAGVTYSVTTAKITITTEKRYGRIRVEAEQFDNETAAPLVTIGATEFRNEGNYKECSYSSSNPNNNTTYWFFLKKYDSLDSQYTTLNKTYGNNEFSIPRNKLASYLTTNPSIYSSIGIESSNSEIVSVTPASPNWNITIRKAGTCTLTFSHSGYVVNESSAYLAYTIDIPVTIHKRNLVISFAPTSTVYGTEATFTYTYTTSATDPAKGTDGYTGLSYQIFSDIPSEIMTGNIINYDKDNAHKESTAYIENNQELHNPYQITVTLGTGGIKASNYNITSAPGSLTVTRKQLSASVSNIGQPNVIRKEYGEVNPTADNVTYEGWIPGETMESLLLLGVPFTPPVLNYQTLIGDPILQFTSIGTYTITLSGGTSKNYAIPTSTVTCIIVPVTPAVVLPSISTTYKAVTIGYPYNDFDEYSNPIVKQASINPVGEGGSVPRAGLVTYQYRYEEQPWSGDKPRRAGTYSTRVLYKAEDGDNYKDATVDFLNNIIIAKAVPTISLGLSQGETQYVRNFTGQPINPATIQPIVSGVGSDKPVGGNIVIQFRITGETEWVNEVTSAGTYDLYIKFIASPTDNYTNYDNPEEPFTAALLIKDGVVDIVLLDGCRVMVDFDGLSHSFDLSKVRFYGSPTDLDEYGFRKVIPGTAIVTYSKDGVTWSSDAPVNAGIYSVSIDYTTEEGTDYEGNTIAFNKYNGQDLFTIYKENIKDYMGINLGSAMQYTYDAEYHIIPANLVTLGKLPDDITGPTGVVSVGYQLSGTPSAPVLARVKDIGSYDVVLQYTEGANDNYVYTVPQRIQARLIVNPAAVQISYASTSNVFDFTGDSHRVTVSMVGVKGEMPKGTLIFEYKLSGEETFTSAAPVDAGSYDMRVTYQRRIDIVDNYAATSDRKDNIITINKISPIIVINDIIVDFGVINAQYVPNVILRGASRDPIGPPLTNVNGTSTVSYEYGVFADNKYNWYQWTSSSYPMESGKYSLRATYNPSYDTDSRNYLTATAVRFMCLEIRNIAPTFVLNGKTVYYNGGSVPASSAIISNAGGLTPPGNISYEYKKQGTFVWRNSPPVEVGVYDVRVKYLESPKGDTFSSFTEVFTSALEILALPITIVPLLGQGNVFGTAAVASGDIVYSYYYELNGMKYFVYPTVFDKRYGENVQVGFADYVAEDGYAYSLDLVDGVACRDFSWVPLSIQSFRFGYTANDGTVVNETVDYNDLVFTDNIAEFSSSGREYIFDSSTGLVRYKNYFENTILTYNTRDGYFFSIIDKDGVVENIEIVERRVIWLNTERTIGNFDVVREGYTVRYTINFNNMTAVAGNKLYTINSSSGYVSYADSSETLKTLLIDQNEVYNRNLQTDTALYKASDGYVYEIDFSENKATRLYPITIENVSFNYLIEDDYSSETQEISVDIALADLTQKYENQTGVYIYEDEERGIDFLIDIQKGIALKDMRYSLLQGPVDKYFEYTMFDGSVRRIDIGYNAYQDTDRPGVYFFQDTIYQSGSYYIDTNLGYVRREENKVNFNLGESEISYMISGELVEIDVDFHEIYFDSYSGNVLSRRLTMFGKKFDFTPPSLITGNSWTGNMRAQLAGAGGYDIEKSTLNAGTNYIVNMSTAGIKYTVDRAPLYVTFSGPADNVYDGASKDISYEVFGLIGNDNVEILGLVENMEGDNVAATRAGYNGFRMSLSIDPNNKVGANYYLTNSRSSYYFINPAVMETITFTPIEGGIVYDGNRHELKLEDIDSSYTVRYNGKENIPSFVNPGTYHITALVTKENYIPQTVNLSLTIKKAVYSVVPNPVTRTLYYGDTMPTLTCPSEEGTVRFIDGQYLHPAITKYYWEFVPFRSDFYDLYQGKAENNYLVKGEMTLNVQKAKPSLQISGNLVQVEETPTALQALINGKSSGSEDISVTFHSTDGTVYTSLPTAPGTYTVVVEYAGDEFYEDTTFETTLTIKEKENMIWLWITGGVIAGLALLSALFFIIRKQKTYA